MGRRPPMMVERIRIEETKLGVLQFKQLSVCLWARSLARRGMASWPVTIRSLVRPLAKGGV
jgi:hypothetical protein